MTAHDMIETAALNPTRRWPLSLAALFLVVFVAAVVGGSALQGVLGLPLQMGWLQQIAAVLCALAFAWACGEFRAQLGLYRPRPGWLWPTMLTGVSITAVGAVAGWLAGIPAERQDAEWFIYQAIAPGLGEELGLRGVLLSLLLVGLARRPAFARQPVLILLLAALPFALLHLLELSGIKLVVIFFFTLYAGMVLGALRLRYGAIWPAVIAHNLANVGSGLLDLALLSRV
jgi:membrane protease YdiL (CAAX protease family)